MNTFEKFKISLANKLMTVTRKKQLLQTGSYGRSFTALAQTYDERRINILSGYSFACINKIAKSVSSYNYYVERVTNDGNVLDERNWVSELINEINPIYDFQDLLELVTIWLKYRGKAFIWAVRGEAKVPYQLWVLPSDDVQINISQNEIQNFTLTVGGSYTVIPKDEIIYLKTLGVSKSNNSIFEGEPNELNAAKEAILTEREKLIFNRQTMQREGTKPYVVTAPDSQDPEALQTFLQSVRENVPSEFRPVMVLTEGKQIQSLAQGSSSSSSVSDVSYLDLIKQVCAIFQVPITLLHGEDANKGSQTTNKNEFYATAVNPVVKLIIKAFNKHFRNIDNQYLLSFDTLQETDPDFILRENQMMLDSGLKTRNEIRLESGYNEIDGGDIYLIKQGYTTADSVLNPPTFQITNEVEKSVTNKAMSINEITKQLYFKKYDTLNLSYTKKLQKIMSKSFLDLYTEILANNNFDSKSIETESNFKLFDVQKWIEILTKNTDKWRTAFIIDVFERALQDVGGNLELSNFQKEIAKISKLSTSKITTSLGTIEEELRSEVQKIVESNPNATKQELNDLFKDNLQHKFVDVLSNSRASNIAQTTSTFTLNQTQKETWKKVGGYKRQWLSQRDGDVRDSHLDADGTFENDKGMFKVGSDTMDVPGGGSEASENCNCRCVTFPVKTK